MPKRVNDLELEQNMAFQEREWAVERVGWVIMALIILAALLGLFGIGPASRVVDGDPASAFSVEYDRFVRYKSPSSLQLQVPSNPDEEGRIRVWFSQEYLQGFEIQRVEPQPESVLVDGDRIYYDFQLAGTGQPADITFDLKPERIGKLSGQIGLQEDQVLDVSQWVYP